MKPTDTTEQVLEALIMRHLTGVHKPEYSFDSNYSKFS